MPKILVIEDDEDVLEILSFIIGNAGYQVVTAYNGKQGLRQALSDRPDLIITDVLMPVMDGYTFYKKLKENRSTAIIPVLILTARGAMEDAFKLVGADDFLAKPFEDYVLLGKISRLLSRPTVLTPPPLPKKKERSYILIAGLYAEVTGSMERQLQEKRHFTKTVLSAAQVISQVLTFEPDILILNVQMAGNCCAEEIVRIIRTLPKFKKMIILLYSYVPVAKLGSQALHEQVTQIDQKRTACMSAGATDYIGEFPCYSFLDSVQRYL